MRNLEPTPVRCEIDRPLLFEDEAIVLIMTPALPNGGVLASPAVVVSDESERDEAAEIEVHGEVVYVTRSDVDVTYGHLGPSGENQHYARHEARSAGTGACSRFTSLPPGTRPLLPYRSTR